MEHSSMREHHLCSDSSNDRVSSRYLADIVHVLSFVSVGTKSILQGVQIYLRIHFVGFISLEENMHLVIEHFHEITL